MRRSRLDSSSASQPRNRAAEGSRVPEPAITHRILAVLLDSGDTLVDEATEVKSERGVTQRAELIPGAAEMVRTLAARGYPIGLVADGFTDTFRNVFSQHGLLGLFTVLAIS